MAFGKNRFAKHSGETKKFGNKKITNEHGTFDSKREWNRYSDHIRSERLRRSVYSVGNTMRQEGCIGGVANDADQERDADIYADELA